MIQQKKVSISKRQKCKRHLRVQQRLPVQCGGCSQPLKVVLLIRRMLVHNEQVLPQPGNDEAKLELANDAHAQEVGLVEHTCQLCCCRLVGLFNFLRVLVLQVNKLAQGSHVIAELLAPRTYCEPWYLMTSE